MISDYEQGNKVRREVLGDEHVSRTEARAHGFGEDFQDFITRCAWGEVWSRPGLDRRSRSIATLAALISLRAENEIALHLRGARRNGLSIDEIKEVILHTAVYAGVPAANAAFAIAQAVMSEDSVDPASSEA